MAKSFGVPYQGSKSKIAEWVVGLLPPATHLYDLMAGGCAVSHCAMLSGKYKEVHVNDITDSVVLSEYSMPSDRFICIGEKPRISTFSATNNSLERVEKLFVPKGQLEMYKRI